MESRCVPLHMNPFSLAASFAAAKGNLEEMEGGRDCLSPVCQLAMPRKAGQTKG